MTEIAMQAPPIEPAAHSSRPNVDKGFNPLTAIIFFGMLAAGFLYVVYSVYSDVNATGTKITTFLPYLLLLVALLIALGFEFVNGFHDTANAPEGDDAQPCAPLRCRLACTCSSSTSSKEEPPRRRTFACEASGKAV